MPIEELVAILLNRMQELEKENKYLKQRLAKYETPKNSNNSSVPPSKDENRPRRTSLREKTGRKPGGQKGREGTTLKMVEVPDSTEKHIPAYCSGCGHDVSAVLPELMGKRQVFDIPKIKVHVTEHQAFRKRCTACGYETTGSFPFHAKAPVSYGNNIESLIGYLHTRQYVPFKRMQEFFNQVLQVPISEGGIHYLLNKLAKKAVPAYQMIKDKLKSETGGFVGSDETGVKVGGEKYWAWTWQNNEATFITITDNRGQKTITETFGDGFGGSVLLHDCWKSHFNTPALSHQVCLAHLLRDLNYLTERYGHKWSRACKTLFKTALNLKSNMSGTDYLVHQPLRASIENRLDKLLKYGLPPEHGELVTFQKRLIKYRNYLLPFLYHPKVPPDNNSSERAIRNIKVKQKVSGQFKSPNGAFIFAVLRSVTDTTLKNKQNVIQTLNTIANLQTD